MLTGLLVGAVLAQATAAPPAADDVVRLERIRKALEQKPAITAETGVDDWGRPVFRMSVQARPEKPLWADWTNVPSYIRPFWRGYHYDYLQMVTPEEFRSGTLYPVGIPVGQLLELLGKHIHVAHRKSQEEKARTEVRQALEEVLACRADPSRPGC